MDTLFIDAQHAEGGLCHSRGIVDDLQAAVNSEGGGHVLFVEFG